MMQFTELFSQIGDVDNLLSAGGDKDLSLVVNHLMAESDAGLIHLLVRDGI